MSAQDRMVAEVVRLSAEGMTQAQIASELGVSQPTVGRYLRRAEAVAAENLQADVDLSTAQALSRAAGLPALPAPERDVLQRPLCRVEGCSEPQRRPTDVCATHAGSPEALQGARLALTDLVHPAIRRLGELVGSQDERVALQASTAILDRAGFGKQVEVRVEDAREVLFERLMQARQAYLDENVIDGEVVEEDLI